MRKMIRPVSSLTALAFSGLTLLAAISPVSATMTSDVPMNGYLQGNQLEVNETRSAQPERYYMALRVGIGTSELCHDLVRQCTLRHGYGNGIFRLCMKRGGCG